jgi:hypothetical protein
MSQDFVLLGCMSRSGRVGSQGSRKELLQLPASVDISKCLQRHVGVYKKDLLELGCCRRELWSCKPWREISGSLV